jgi:hypothetical protein
MQGLVEMKKEPRTRGAYRPRFLALFSVREKEPLWLGLFS